MFLTEQTTKQTRESGVQLQQTVQSCMYALALVEL